MDELRKGIAIGMLLGSGSEGHGNLMTKTATENGTYTAAEEIDPETGEIFDPPKDGYSVFTVDLALDDKSVSITTSQITGSQTAEFEYDPHDENPELEGYSLFTIDLSAVKDDIEELQQIIDDINQLLEEDDPDYDPTTDDPVRQLNDVIEEKDQKEQEAEECEECRAEVIAKMQEYDPDFNPQTCQDMVDEIDKIANEHDGYEFPENTPKEKIDEITGLDTIYDPDFDYYVKYYSVLDGRYGSEYGHIYKYGNIYETLHWQDPGAGNTIAFYGYIEVYKKSDNVLIDRRGLGTNEGMVYGSEYGYYDNIVFDPTTGTYTMNENFFTGSRLITRPVTYQNNLLIGYGTSGKWKVKNS